MITNIARYVDHAIRNMYLFSPKKNSHFKTRTNKKHIHKIPDKNVYFLIHETPEEQNLKLKLIAQHVFILNLFFPKQLFEHIHIHILCLFSPFFGATKTIFLTFIF